MAYFVWHICYFNSLMVLCCIIYGCSEKLEWSEWDFVWMQPTKHVIKHSQLGMPARGCKTK